MEGSSFETARASRSWSWTRTGPSRLALLAILAGCFVSEDEVRKAHDRDGDGYCEALAGCAEDCDDDDAAVHPGAEELCNTVDDNCDGRIDEALQSTWYDDLDGDGFGSGDGVPACEAGVGQVEQGGDCDDAVVTTFPYAPEACNGADDDCDGAVDDAAMDMPSWYADTDGDGYGDAQDALAACEAPEGRVADRTDCDDGLAEVHPGAVETCDNDDEDCDRQVDEEAVDAPTWYADLDGDEYGDAGSTVVQCEAPSEYVRVAGDCDDDQDWVRPEVPELCNGFDDDCDGDIDDDDPDVDPDSLSSWYSDADNDGAGVDGGSVQACDAPADSVAEGGDCDDQDAAIFPGADERCNGYDDDCDTATGESGLATFYAANGATTDYSAFLAGTAQAPTAVTLTADGELWICPGTWYTRVELAADVALVGYSAAAAVVLDGGGAGSVVTVETDGVVVSLEGLTLQGGDATYGGGLHCQGASDDPDVTLDNMVVTGNLATNGGGLSMDRCVLDATDTMITGNTASMNAGGVWSSEATLTLSTDSVVSGNSAGGDGGGLAINSSYLDLYLATVSDNAAGDQGGGMYSYDTDSTCTGASGRTAGFIDNVASTEFGGVYVDSSSTFESIDCDFGTSGNSDDNDPDDIATSSYPYLYSDDANFTCDATRCGTLTTTTVSTTTSGTVGPGSSWVRGNVFTATREATLESWEFYLIPSSSTCELYWYLLSAASTSDASWAVEWSGTTITGSSAAAYYASGTVGVPIRSGDVYAFVTAWTCDGTCAYENPASVLDVTLGNIGNHRWSHESFLASDYEGATVVSRTRTDGAFTAYHQRYTWSH